MSRSTVSGVDRAFLVPRPRSVAAAADFGEDGASKGYKRAGGQANVIIYTGDSAILNSCGKLWVRLISKLSHIY